MSLKNLSFAELGVLKSLLGFSSTSETIMRGFLQFDLSCFSGGYTNLTTAWERLDSEQRQAVCDVWEVTNIGIHDVNIGRRIIPTETTFVDNFVLTLIRSEMSDREVKWFDDNPHYRDEDLPPDVISEHKRQIQALISPHVTKRYQI